MPEKLNHLIGGDARWWQAVLYPALAGGMAWGIRGQYGHETGAMIAGLLVSLTLAVLLCPKATSLQIAVAVAWCTVAMGFGGTETYGQTVGLTHDKELLGNWAALRWGMLGLAIKGGAWIGFAGLFLGMGLGGKRYRPLELLLMMLGGVAVFYAGVALFNSPYDPANKILPAVYFSDDWRWEPGAVLTPRREVWGGLLLALAALMAYTGKVRKDGLAWRLGLWGVLGGALGFPLGQCLQAYHAWNRELFRSGLWAWLDPHMNWWNMMETTFGAVMGGVLGLGAWLNRKRIQPAPDEGTSRAPAVLGWALLVVRLVLLVSNDFPFVRAAGRVYNNSLLMGLIPIVAAAAWRWWPYMILMPITLIPIAGKTVRELVYKSSAIDVAAGWIVYLVLPLLMAVAAAVWFAREEGRSQQGSAFPRHALLLSTWIYFLLNFAFFRFPWPWTNWTGRTPNGIIFTVCALGLTALALRSRHRGAGDDKGGACKI